jgi:hypothetical protein
MQPTLWVEDNPTFFEKHGALSGELGKILANTTFAFDYADAASKIVTHQGRFILDADFPATNDDWRRKSLTNFLEARRAGKEVSCPYQSCGDAGYENFVPLYDEFEHLMRGKTVVYSISRMAPVFAFLRNLPFYSKSDDDPKENVRDQFTVRGDTGDFMHLRGPPKRTPVVEFHQALNAWETGNSQDLLERYLR